MCEMMVICMFVYHSVLLMKCLTCAAAAKVVYDTHGGTDIGIAEKRVAHLCNIEFPRTVGWGVRSYTAVYTVHI